MHPPLIGISCGTSRHDEHAKTEQDRLNMAYSNAIQEAGGLPIILPNVGDRLDTAALLDRLDGLLLSGGYDVCPAVFGEETLNESVEVDEARDATELPLIREAVHRQTPILAICRGIQSLNVALGGTLYQDLPVQAPSGIPHRQNAPRHAATHSIAIESGSRLAEAVGDTQMEVNSFHHQALRDVADGLKVVAKAPDGTIEAVEAPAHRFLVAVQFHPEEMTGSSEKARKLFRAFVEAAQTEA